MAWCHTLFCFFSARQREQNRESRQRKQTERTGGESRHKKQTRESRQNDEINYSHSIIQSFNHLYQTPLLPIPPIILRSFPSHISPLSFYLYVHIPSLNSPPFPFPFRITFLQKGNYFPRVRVRVHADGF